MNLNFGGILKDLRKSHNLTQGQLAEKLDVAKSTISMYEMGGRSPDMEMLLKIANVFNVDVNYLFGIAPESKEINNMESIPYKRKDNKVEKKLESLVFAKKIEITKIVVRSGGVERRNLYLRDGTLISGSENVNGEIVTVGFDDIIHVAQRIGDGPEWDPVRFVHWFFELDGQFIAKQLEGINWSFSDGFRM